MTVSGKTYQYRLTEAECQLHNLLRRLEAEFEDEFLGIFNGANLPKLFVPTGFCAKTTWLMKHLGISLWCCL